MPIDLSLAMGMSPEKAIEYFESKGYKITWAWQDLWQESQAKAFTVAGITKLDVLQDIRSAVGDALKLGKTQSEFSNDLVPILKRKGWWGANAQTDTATGEVSGKGLTAYRLKTIFQTNMQTAYMAGRYKAFMGNVDDRPWWEYVAVLDSRTRPSHRALNGRTFRYDDPFWNSFYPPNGFNCRCRVRARSQDDIDAGLYPSDSAGNLVKTQRLVSKRTGELADVTGYRDPVTKKLFTPDVGWSYNPGKAWAKPFTPPPLDNLPATFAPGIKLPDLPTPIKIAADRLLPDNLSAEQYAKAFLAEFGADINQSVVFRDVAGDSLAISDDLFKDGAGEWKIKKDGRAPYVHLLADTIKQPDEIWLRWEESHDHPGNWLLKRRYIKAFEMENGLFGLGVFERGTDGWTGSTVFMPKPDRTEQARKNYIEAQRDGFLQYRKN